MNPIGLTGLIGSGKSLVGEYFKNLSINIIDTDKIAHELTSTGGKAIPLISQKFDRNFLALDGSLDRNKMRNLVFKDISLKTQLENILHPLIYEQMLIELNTSISLYTIIIIPLLFKSKRYLNLIKRSIFVDCNENALIKRVMERSNLTTELIQEILKNQVDRDTQLAMADDIIDNNQDVAYLEKQVIELNMYYQELFSNVK